MVLPVILLPSDRERQLGKLGTDRQTDRQTLYLCGGHRLVFNLEGYSVWLDLVKMGSSLLLFLHLHLMRGQLVLR